VDFRLTKPVSIGFNREPRESDPITGREPQTDSPACFTERFPVDPNVLNEPRRHTRKFATVLFLRNFCCCCL